MFLPILITAAVSPSEHTVFTCRIGDRVAMVVREGSNLAYRSIRRGGLELQIPDGSYAREGFSGGGELQAIFKNGPWTYVVFERTIRTNFTGPNTPSFEAGVDVLRPGRVVARRRCDDAETQFAEQLDGAPKAPFVEH